MLYSQCIYNTYTCTTLTLTPFKLIIPLGVGCTRPVEYGPATHTADVDITTGTGLVVTVSLTHTRPDACGPSAGASGGCGLGWTSGCGTGRDFSGGNIRAF